MNAIKGGDPVFPSVFLPGISMRDYFAAKAVAGLCANQEWMVNARNASGKEMHDCVSIAAYELADAMLSAREGGAK